MRKILSGRERSFLFKFLGSFFIIYAAIYAADYLLPGVFVPLERVIALSEASFLSSMEIPATAVGTTVFAAGISFSMAIECTGLVMTAMLLCLLYATDQKQKKIAYGLLLGIPIIFLFNLARVLLTLLVAITYGNATFEAVHALLWFVDALVVIAIWAYVTDFKL